MFENPYQKELQRRQENMASGFAEDFQVEKPELFLQAKEVEENSTRFVLQHQDCGNVRAAIFDNVAFEIYPSETNWGIATSEKPMRKSTSIILMCSCGASQRVIPTDASEELVGVILESFNL